MSRRGQATAEFMVLFLASVSFVGIVAASLLSASHGAEEQADSVLRIMAVEEAARAIEVHANSGITMLFEIEGVESAVEGGSVHVDYEGKVIEAEGVFDGYSKEGQPV